MTLRLDENLDLALAKLAEETHRPKSEIVTIAVDEYIARSNRAARLDAISARIIEADAGLFARLADA